MKLTMKNIQEFKEWELGRDRISRLRGIKTQLKGIKSYYEKHGAPPQQALLEEFSFRLYLFCIDYYGTVYVNNKPFYIAGWEIVHFGEMLRYNIVYHQDKYFYDKYKPEFENYLVEFEKELSLLSKEIM